MRPLRYTCVCVCVCVCVHHRVLIFRIHSWVVSYVWLTPSHFFLSRFPFFSARPTLPLPVPLPLPLIPSLTQLPRCVNATSPRHQNAQKDTGGKRARLPKPTHRTDVLNGTASPGGLNMSRCTGSSTCFMPACQIKPAGKCGENADVRSHNSRVWIRC